MAEANIRSGTITGITPQRRNPNRVSIAIDGEFALGVDQSVAESSRLYVGQWLSDDDLRRLAAADDRARAIEAGLRYLEYRPRSERETRQRLREKAYSPIAIDQAIEQLKAWKYLDDETFARFWVENRQTFRPRGSRLLRSELGAKGVPRELASAVVEELGGDELPAALELARKRLASLQDLEPLVQRRRLSAFLQRRGYDWETVRSVLAEVLQAEPEDAGE
ncbi:MAG TPA: regulatory protein RecX [Thermomicrobiaceae bacterium]|nr:regulatory protein RecX [Thermomicrobiaceae bacterium]